MVNYSSRATIALCAIVARQSTRQFSQRDTPAKCVYSNDMRWWRLNGLASTVKENV